MEDDTQIHENETVEKRKEEKEGKEEDLLQFLDSFDSYLTLFDSLSSSLRQGWLDLASARYSMGSSRVSSALLDLKLHSAASTLQVSELHDESTLADSMVNQPHFTLSKWGSLDDRKCHSMEAEVDDNLQKKSFSPQLRSRGPTHFTDEHGKGSQSNETSRTADDQKERAKALSVFGTLVSPKLRVAQVSFERALEIITEIANAQSAMRSAFARITQDTKGMQ